VARGLLVSPPGEPRLHCAASMNYSQCINLPQFIQLYEWVPIYRQWWTVVYGYYIFTHLLQHSWMLHRELLWVMLCTGCCTII